MLNFDTIIIGAGAAGMSAALYLKRAGDNVLLIDKDAPGGAMLKTNKIENYIGFDSISGSELALKMFNQTKKNNIPFEFSEVLDVNPKGPFFEVKTTKKTLTCKNVIIATGRIPKKLAVPYASKIKGVSYCAVCDGTFYKNKEVGVVGGGNTAVSNAIYLSDLCSNVYIFVRSELRADKELIEKAKNKENIVIIKGVNITELLCLDNNLTGVILDDGKKISLEGLFVCMGGRPHTDFITGLDLEKGYIKVNKKMETNIPSVYAIGDAIYKDFYQLSLAVSEGAIAALSIKERD